MDLVFCVLYRGVNQPVWEPDRVRSYTPWASDGASPSGSRCGSPTGASYAPWASDGASPSGSRCGSPTGASYTPWASDGASPSGSRCGSPTGA